jgi:hypothetical protein
LLHRGSFLVNIPLRNLRALFLLWKFINCEVRLNVAQVTQLSVQTGTFHPRILFSIVPKRDVVQCIPEHGAETIIFIRAPRKPSACNDVQHSARQMRPNEERGLRPLLRVNEKIYAMDDQLQEDPWATSAMRSSPASIT